MIKPVWTDNDTLHRISLHQQGKDKFSVEYGKQIFASLTYAQAAAKLGEAIMRSYVANAPRKMQ